MKRGGSVAGSLLVSLLKFSYRNVIVQITSMAGTKYHMAKSETNVIMRTPVPTDFRIVKESLGINLEETLGEHPTCP